MRINSTQPNLTPAAETLESDMERIVYLSSYIEAHTDPKDPTVVDDMCEINSLTKTGIPEDIDSLLAEPTITAPEKAWVTGLTAPSGLLSTLGNSVTALNNAVGSDNIAQAARDVNNAAFECELTPSTPSHELKDNLSKLIDKLSDDLNILIGDINGHSWDAASQVFNTITDDYKTLISLLDEFCTTPESTGGASAAEIAFIKDRPGTTNTGLEYQIKACYGNINSDFYPGGDLNDAADQSEDLLGLLVSLKTYIQ